MATTDEQPVSLKALDAIRRCAETDMRRNFDGDLPDSKRARHRQDRDAPAAADAAAADAAAAPSSEDKKAAFHEVARFAYAAVDALYGGGGAKGGGDGGGGGGGGGGATRTTTATRTAAPRLAFLVSSDMRHDKSGIREAERLLGFERLAPVKLACRGVALLLAPPPPPPRQGKDKEEEEEAGGGSEEEAGGCVSLAAAERVLSELDAGGGGVARPRFCLRIQPVAATCSATCPVAVAEAARRVCEAHRLGAAARAATAVGGGGAGGGGGGDGGGGGGEAASVKFAVVYKARHEGTSKDGTGNLRASVIRAVAGAMERAYGGGGGGGGGGGDSGQGGEKSAASADLKKPDVVIFADVVPVAARPREPLLLLSPVVPARACSLGGKIHFRGLAAAAAAATREAAAAEGGGGGGSGGEAKREAAAVEGAGVEDKSAPPATV